MMDERVKLAADDYLRNSSVWGVITGQYQPMRNDLQNHYRIVFAAGWEAAQRSPALDEPGKEGVER